MGFLRRGQNKAKDRGSAGAANAEGKDGELIVARGDVATKTTKRSGLGALFKKSKSKSSNKTKTPSKTPHTAHSTPRTIEDQSPTSSRPRIAIIPASTGNIVTSDVHPSSFLASQELDEETATSAALSGDDGVARNLLAELNLAVDADGTELILPTVQYPDNYLGYVDNSDSDHPDDEPPSPARITVREKQPGEEEYTPTPPETPAATEAPRAARITVESTSLVNDSSPAEAASMAATRENESSLHSPAVQPTAPVTITNRRVAEGASEGWVDDPKGNSLLAEETYDENPTNPAHREIVYLDSNPLQKAMNTNSTTTSTFSVSTSHTTEKIKGISGAIMNALSCTPDNVERWSSMVPATCAPVINTTKRSRSKNDARTRPSHEYFNDQFAVKFLHGMLNVGFTLVYHKSVDDEYWVGRTVNMFFKPGLCTSVRMELPSIEWATMGGGKTEAVETKSIPLLGVDAISVSNFRSGLNLIGDRETRDDGGTSLVEMEQLCNLSACSDDELDCFFTITSEDGEVHLFESLSSEESNRIVAGIKNIASRFCSQLIAGDSNAVADFFDNTQEPEERQLSMEEAMLRVSNCFLDGLM